jgi:hypothetical protein
MCDDDDETSTPTKGYVSPRAIRRQIREAEEARGESNLHLRSEEPLPNSQFLSLAAMTSSDVVQRNLLFSPKVKRSNTFAAEIDSVYKRQAMTGVVPGGGRSSVASLRSLFGGLEYF